MVRNTGRSATIRSSRARDGVPPGKLSIDQPLPEIQGASGFAVAYAAIRSRYSCTPVVPVRSHWPSSMPLGHRVAVRVLEAGQQQPPAQVDDLGTGPGELGQLVAADGQDPALAHGERGGAPGGLAGQHGAAGEQQVSDGVRHGRQRSPGTPDTES
nr:hypothetical protein GCM10020092_062490 [Actinoplanes digitatis]